MIAYKKFGWLGFVSCLEKIPEKSSKSGNKILKIIDENSEVRYHKILEICTFIQHCSNIR